MDDHFTRTMSISHQEFFRLLPRAVGKYPFKINAAVTEIQLDEGQLEIRLSEEKVRHIASLKLPETCLEFNFTGVSEKTKIGFLTQFNRVYQRGGG